MGLSTLHKRTQREVNKVDAGIKVWSEGSLAQVSRELIVKSCASCGQLFKVLPRRSDEVLLCRRCQVIKKRCSCGYTWYEERYPGKISACVKCGEVYQANQRSKVTGFSFNSRRRLMRILAQLKKSVLPCFVTLTYPDTWEGHSDPEAWKVTLKRFEARFRREYPGASYIWRQEVIDRKSGERIGQLSPHFHLLIFGVSYAKLRSWVPVTWYEVVATGDDHHLEAGTQVSRVKSRRGLMSYASKAVGRVMSGELAKMVQAEGGSAGRWWGIVLRDNFIAWVSEVKEYALSELQAMLALRSFRKKAKIRSRDYSSLFAFIDGAWLLLNLPRLVVPVVVKDRYRVTGRPYVMPFYQFMGCAYG